MKKFYCFVILLFLIVLVGCGEDNNPISDTPSTTTTQSSDSSNIAVSTINAQPMESQPAATNPKPEQIDPLVDLPIDLREYIPLEIGNRWTYQQTADGAPLQEYTLSISKITAKGYQIDKETKCCIPSVLYNWAIEGNKLLESGWVYLDRTMIVGKERVTVPAGTFDCIKVQRNTLYAEPSCEWYGKSVGLVKVDYGILKVTIDGPSSVNRHIIDILISYEIK